VFILGVNYWPRTSSIDMYREMNAEDIGKDLEVIKNLGFNAVRIFILLRDFVDENGDIDAKRVDFVKAIGEKAKELGLSLYPTLITIHMSGRNWHSSLIKGSLYDLKTLDAMQVFLAKIVRELKSIESIRGWILTNEASLVEAPPDAESYRAWARSLVLVVKAIDDSRPLGLGDLVPFVPGTDPESLDTLPIDFVDLHIYNYDNDEVRQSLYYSAISSLFIAENRPVIVEELGCSSAVFSEDSVAQFMSVVLHSLLCNGVSGAFLWCFADYVPEKEHLFEFHPYEMRFGVVRSDGSPKPVATVVRNFSRLLEELERMGLGEKFVARPREVAVVLVRNELSTTTTRLIGFDLRPGLSAVIESYVMFKGVSAPVTLVYEASVGMTRYKLYALPSIRLASVTTWRRLKSEAMNGAVIYASILRSRENPHGIASHVWEELFGVSPKLKACAIGRALEGPIVLEFLEDFGSVKRGERIRVRLGTRFSAEIFAWEAEPTSARVAAVLPDGTPAIFVNSVGKGFTVLSIIPLEYVLASNDRIDRASKDAETIYKFYESLVELARVERLFIARDPRVEVEYFKGKKECIVFVINHSYDHIEEVVVKCASKIKSVDKLGGDASLENFEGNELRLRMPSRSVIVLRVS